MYIHNYTSFEVGSETSVTALASFTDIEHTCMNPLTFLVFLVISNITDRTLGQYKHRMNQYRSLFERSSGWVATETLEGLYLKIPTITLNVTISVTDVFFQEPPFKHTTNSYIQNRNAYSWGKDLSTLFSSKLFNLYKIYLKLWLIVLNNGWSFLHIQ